MGLRSSAVEALPNSKVGSRKGRNLSPGTQRLKTVRIVLGFLPNGEFYTNLLTAGEDFKPAPSCSVAVYCDILLRDASL